MKRSHFITAMPYLYVLTFFFGLWIVFSICYPRIPFYWDVIVILAYFTLAMPWLVSSRLSDKLNFPGKSILNPFGLIELHVNNEAVGNRRLFYKYCAEALRLAYYLNTDVIFITWLTDVDTMTRRFGKAVEIYNLNFIEIICNAFFRFKYNSKSNIPAKVYVIRTNKLSQDTIDHYTNRAAQLNKKTL